MEPVAETERLRLRRLRTDDAAFLLQLLNQPSWLAFIGDRNVRSVAQARDYLEQRIDSQFERHGYGMWGVELRAAGPAGTRQPDMGQPDTRAPNTVRPSTPQPDTAHPIGLAGLVKRDYLPHPDLGFALLDAYAGQGLAHEAACAVLALARARGLNRLLAITDADNRRSIALLHRLGFELEGPQAVPGGPKPMQRYSRSVRANER